MRLLIEYLATLEDFAELYPVPTLFKVYFPMIYYARIIIKRRVEGLIQLRKKVYQTRKQIFFSRQ